MGKVMSEKKYKKYNIIYADPPWNYKVWSKKGAGRTASSHYNVMKIEDLKLMPISVIRDLNCALFMWATYPNLLDAIELGKAWGFIYKTVAFTWVKKNKIKDSYFTGMGYYTRANAEICLLFMKGMLKRVDKGVPQIIDAKIREHSRKPDEARDRIVRLFGDLPRIELFARETFSGWDVYGNETEKFNNEL